MGSRVGNAGVRVRNGRSPRSNFYPGLKTTHILGSREGDMYRGPLIAVTAVLNKRRRGNVASDQGKEFSKQTVQECISIKLSPTISFASF